MAEDEPISFLVDPGQKFSKAVKEASKRVLDLTIPLQLIARQWFKSNRAIFALKSEGKFEDLTDAYKDVKELQPPRGVGFIYPILKRSGLLEKSITDPTDTNSVNLIINKQGLIMGTKVAYAPYLHFGTKKMDARPFVMIGAEQTGPEEFNNRQSAWIHILQTYLLQALSDVGETRGS